MKKVLSTVGFVLIGLVFALAQTPKYFCSTYAGSGPATVVTTAQIFNGRYQGIYYPSNFPGMPNGSISAIYIRVGRVMKAPPHAFEHFTLRLGYTADSSYPNWQTGYDTFKTGLTTVLDVPSFTFSNADTVGKWLKIPLQETNFVYDKSKLLVFDLSFGPHTSVPVVGIDLMAMNNGAPKRRTLFGIHRDSIRSKSTAPYFLDLGFDLITTDVSALTNIRNFGLWPSAGEGVFQVSFESSNAIKSVNILVTDVTGRSVINQRHSGNGTSFLRSLDISSLPSGVYLVQVLADGERLTRRYVKQ